MQFSGPHFWPGHCFHSRAQGWLAEASPPAPLLLGNSCYSDSSDSELGLGFRVFARHLPCVWQPAACVRPLPQAGAFTPSPGAERASLGWVISCARMQSSGVLLQRARHHAARRAPSEEAVGVRPRLPIPSKKSTKERGANFITWTSEGIGGEVPAMLPRHPRPKAYQGLGGCGRCIAQILRVPARKTGADCCHGDPRDKSETSSAVKSLENLSISRALKPKAKEPRPAQPLRQALGDRSDRPILCDAFAERCGQAENWNGSGSCFPHRWRCRVVLKMAVVQALSLSPERAWTPANIQRLQKVAGWGVLGVLGWLGSW